MIYKILYWTYDNWDGDPDEVIFDLERAPTNEDLKSLVFQLESRLFNTISSIKVVTGE